LRKLIVKSTEQKWSGRWDSNPQPPTWEGKYSALYFQHLQNRSAKTYLHALHTVHALPDLRIAAGRLRDVFHHSSFTQSHHATQFLGA